VRPFDGRKPGRRALGNRQPIARPPRESVHRRFDSPPMLMRRVRPSGPQCRLPRVGAAAVSYCYLKLRQKSRQR
jgi:hypothetical protein